MSVAIWPEDLPKPRRDGYAAGINDPRIAKNTDAGPVGWRRRWSSHTKAVSLVAHLDRNEKAIFDNFYEYECQVGSLPFRMPDPVTDNWPLLTSDGESLLLSDGEPILMAATWLCIWGQSVPQESMVGRHFKVSFSVVVMP